MDLYFPIAGTSFNALLLIFIGVGVGFLSGLFGISGGFLITPLLMFFNVSPAIAVGTAAHQALASSLVGTLTHIKNRSLDIKIGIVLALSGFIGALCGIKVFSFLKASGQLEFVIFLLYIFLLGGIGLSMAFESLYQICKNKGKKQAHITRRKRRKWLYVFPLKIYFKESRLYVSIIPLIFFGFFIGLISSIMGIGGGFITVPLLTYLFRVPQRLIIGTSLFQVAFICSCSTILQASVNHSVDVLLSLFLMLGGVVGAQLGTKAGYHLKAESLRIFLSMMILAIVIEMAFKVLTPPSIPISVQFGM